MNGGGVEKKWTHFKKHIWTSESSGLYARSSEYMRPKKPRMYSENVKVGKETRWRGRLPLEG